MNYPLDIHWLRCRWFQIIKMQCPSLLKQLRLFTVHCFCFFISWSGVYRLLLSLVFLVTTVYAALSSTKGMMTWSLDKKSFNVRGRLRQAQVQMCSGRRVQGPAAFPWAPCDLCSLPCTMPWDHHARQLCPMKRYSSSDCFCCVPGRLGMSSLRQNSSSNSHKGDVSLHCCIYWFVCKLHNVTLNEKGNTDASQITTGPPMVSVVACLFSLKICNLVTLQIIILRHCRSEFCRWICPKWK